jgi:RND superfamily putative drug exporter
MLTGLAVTGGVITSAGVVLAATFGALGTVPILFLQQIAFLVAFGVLVDTLVVRSLLVPALGYDIGRAIWWPGALARRRAPVGEGAGPVSRRDGAGRPAGAAGAGAVGAGGPTGATGAAGAVGAARATEPADGPR